MEEKNFEEMSVSTLFSEIEKTAKELERTDIELEDAFTEYKNGVRAVKILKDKLSDVKGKVSLITEDGELKDFMENGES
ncbi:MAG: exodeoxyribonuclease VII small subunit [Lachnospiraceae bacterium]|nr:exodeoxyribonuclease VII small subunit [Lachnospiraceae bacterium]